MIKLSLKHFLAYFEGLLALLSVRIVRGGVEIRRDVGMSQVSVSIHTSTRLILSPSLESLSLLKPLIPNSYPKLASKLPTFLRFLQSFR